MRNNLLWIKKTIRIGLKILQKIIARWKNKRRNGPLSFYRGDYNSFKPSFKNYGNNMHHDHVTHIKEYIMVADLVRRLKKQPPTSIAGKYNSNL